MVHPKFRTRSSRHEHAHAGTVSPEPHGPQIRLIERDRKKDKVIAGIVRIS